MGNEIAVIIPTYNSEKTIQRCIHSVHNQKLNNYAMKIIVVDDGSTDNTKQIVQNMKYVVWCDNPEHTGGPNRGRTTGIELADGAKYIAFIDHDDEWTPTKLMMQIDALDKSGLDVSYTGYNVVKEGKNMDFVYGHGHTVKYAEDILFKIYLMRDMTKYILPFMSCLVLRNKDIPEFDHPVYDYGWILKVLQGTSVAYVDLPLMIRYETEGNYSKDEKYLEDAVKYINKTLKKYKRYIQARLGRKNFNFDYYIKHTLEGNKWKAWKFLFKIFI